jgi:uncharacterized membrane protein
MKNFQILLFYRNLPIFERLYNFLSYFYKSILSGVSSIMYFLQKLANLLLGNLLVILLPTTSIVIKKTQDNKDVTIYVIIIFVISLFSFQYTK